MKFAKRIGALMLGTMIAIGSTSVNTFAENYVIITESTASAKVVEIIDGDAVKVELLGSGEIALVKLVGIDSHGYNGAVKYLTDKILGAVVTLVKDSNLNIVSGCWNYRYIIYGGINISNDLVAKGYASVDNAQASGSMYSYLSASERSAKSGAIEYWNYGTNNNNSAVLNGFAVNRTSASPDSNRININTATVKQLTDRLEGVNEGIAQKIVTYRRTNPFNTKGEILFVSGFTKEMYQANADKLVVCTNLNTATEPELKTIANLTDDEVNQIIAYRTRYSLNSIADIKTKKFVDEDKFSQIADFISCTDKTSIDATESGYVINFNTATDPQLQTAGLSASDIARIKKTREHGYSMKSIMEILKIDGINQTEDKLNQFEDNWHAVTDLNFAKDTELRSMFSTPDIAKIKEARTINNIYELADIVGNETYNKVKGTIYCSKNNNSYVNINTATASQVELTGMSYEKAVKIVESAPYKTGSDLHYDISDYDDRITLYTNINRAPVGELKTLNHGITDTLINAIVDYREEQPFGSMEDVRDFFTSKNAEDVYNGIKNYIVLR